MAAKDKILSLDWYGRAAVAGNDYAKERLGVLLGRAEYPVYMRALNGDPDAAFDVAKVRFWCARVCAPAHSRHPSVVTRGVARSFVILLF